MSNIELKHLTFGYGAALIFDDATINVDEHWRLGLVGRNGRGKSTLLRLLAGQLSCATPLHFKQNFIYFPQNITNPAELTFYVLSNLTEFEQWQLERELTLLQVDLEVLWRPFDSLSGGEQTKCLLALLFLDEQHFALLDEPTNHLDLPSRQLVATYLSRKSGFIVVSHDRQFLDAVTDHTLVIERSQIQLYQGNFSTYEQEKSLRDDFEQAQNDKLQKEISRLKQTSLEKRDWSNQRENVAGATFVDKKVAKKQNQRAKSMEKRLARELSDKEKLLKNIEKVEKLSMNFQPDHHKISVKFDNFQLGFDSPLFEPIKFDIGRCEIIALTGANGTGKSTLARFLQGSSSAISTGQIELASGLKISTVRQIFDNRGSLSDFANQEHLDYELFLSNLTKLGLPRTCFSQAIESLSQGQQKKVELAKSLSQPAQLYIWDEPLNYLDLFNQQQLIDLLQTCKPTMLLIEHDRHLIEAVASRQITLSPLKKD